MSVILFAFKNFLQIHLLHSQTPMNYEHQNRPAKNEKSKRAWNHITISNT